VINRNLQIKNSILLMICQGDIGPLEINDNMFV
jgi:hypothetical protein